MAKKADLRTASLLSDCSNTEFTFDVGIISNDDLVNEIHKHYLDRQEIMKNKEIEQYSYHYGMMLAR